MKKRTKHNYTSELELKCLLIRIKNTKLKKNYSLRYNNLINKYTSLHNKLNDKKYPKLSPMIQKKRNLRNHLKERAIKLSEVTNIDTISHERFGEVILLMIKHILTKPNFSGYTYISEFYSDAIYKILKYLHNFDHTLISDRTNISVNSFAYISQIIHNSIVFIIKKKKKEQINIDNQISIEIANHSLNIQDHHKFNKSTYIEEDVIKEYKIGLGDELISSVKNILKKHGEIQKNEQIIIYYPKSYKFTMEIYNELHPILQHVSIVSY